MLPLCCCCCFYVREIPYYETPLYRHTTGNIASVSHSHFFTFFSGFFPCCFNFLAISAIIRFLSSSACCFFRKVGWRLCIMPDELPLELPIIGSFVRGFIDAVQLFAVESFMVRSKPNMVISRKSVRFLSASTTKVGTCPWCFFDFLVDGGSIICCWSIRLTNFEDILFDWLGNGNENLLFCISNPLLQSDLISLPVDYSRWLPATENGTIICCSDDARVTNKQPSRLVADNRLPVFLVSRAVNIRRIRVTASCGDLGTFIPD